MNGSATQLLIARLRVVARMFRTPFNLQCATLRKADAISEYWAHRPDHKKSQYLFVAHAEHQKALMCSMTVGQPQQHAYLVRFGGPRARPSSTPARFVEDSYP